MLPITRKDARELGSKQYFTGEPCKHGHVSPRSTAKGTCAGCRRIESKAYREENKEKIRQASKQYRAKNAESIKIKSAEYREKNRESRNAKNRAYYAENRERVLAKDRERYQGRRDEKLAKGREWYHKNLDKEKARSRAYLQANMDKNRAAAARRKASRLQATPSWADLEAIAAIYKHAHLLSKVTGNKYQVDHIIPLRGKTVSGLHVHQNLQILSATDNMSKGNKLLPEFANG